MGVLALDPVQVSIPAGEEARATALYRDLPAMEVVEKPAPMRANGGAWFRSGRAELHLGVEPDFPPARKAHPALRADNLDALGMVCESAGFEIFWDDRYLGVRRFYVADPFGNRVEIMQPG
ncbi:MAG TPA: hypothetical protein VF665_08435 [Longimicrobium sp.]|jgi:catechol 2,3-dioxygenase-like lactoylglutathione lyase family enzyme|uniref:hypothetical protein n=1 Tax=Longimicrobium sp. TaxID=2029185 RepID=UPI002ED818B3